MMGMAKMRILGVSLAIVLVLAMIMPIHVMALGVGMHIGRDGYWFPPIQPKPTSTTTNTGTSNNNNNQPPPQPKIIATTTSTSTSTSTTTSTSSYTTSSTSSYTILQDIEKYLEWLAWTPQGQCQAGLCMLRQLMSMSIGPVTTSEHGGNGNSHALANTIYVPAEYALFQYSDFGIQPTMVIVKVYHTYTTTTITRTIVETINTVRTITNTITTILDTGTGPGTGPNGKNPGPNSGNNPGGWLPITIPQTILIPGKNYVGNSFFWDEIKGLSLIIGGGYKVASKIFGIASYLANQLANWLSNQANNLRNYNNPITNAIANGLNWLANGLSGAGLSLGNLAGELLGISNDLVQFGQSANTAWYPVTPSGPSGFPYFNPGDWVPVSTSYQPGPTLLNNVYMPQPTIPPDINTAKPPNIPVVQTNTPVPSNYEASSPFYFG